MREIGFSGAVEETKFYSGVLPENILAPPSARIPHITNYLTISALAPSGPAPQ
jgi:hypothetical protein